MRSGNMICYCRQRTEKPPFVFGSAVLQQYYLVPDTVPLPNKRFTEQFTVKTPQKNIHALSKATSRASSSTPESELK